MSDSAAMANARRMALAFLSQFSHPGEKEVEQAVTVTVAGLTSTGVVLDPAALRRRLEADVNVFVGHGAVMEDEDANHRPWLEAKRAEIEWQFWEAYGDWVGTTMPPEVLRGIDRMTDDVLGRLEDPRREGRWDRRGMVVGQVQSGKTANYNGLICKAADAGYNFIVVLAGVHNSLRSQTQRRLDEGFLGLDSRTSLAFENTNRAIGVGAGGRRHPAAYTLTSSDERGDFAKGIAGRMAGRIGSDPVLLVVKKHKTILTNLIEWVTQANGQLDPKTGRMVVSRLPLLVIDDEADHASVNTKKIEYERDEDGAVVGETDPAAINRLIRRLLRSFDRSALVSYTATPFANIFIDEEEGPSEAHGEDLFPRSFILRIPPPSNYTGPAEVFGLAAADDPDGVERPGLPVLRSVTDHEGWLETGHKKDATPGPLPKSLTEAIRAFILVCAARAARGQVDVHNSMLVHVTRFVLVQGLVREQIDQEMESLRDRLLGRGGRADRAAVVNELSALWQRDFVPTFGLMPRGGRAPVAWEAVEARLAAAAGRIGPVLEINGSARDALTYTDHPTGISVIAVGGDKLSRGLTLEGLSVSYYLRASRMYDTLMQMGRWFGYREGYGDLMRLYTTDELQSWYRDITVANEELGAKFDEMARVGSNPRDFSLYVRKSPAGLLVTAQAKMRSGRDMELSFSDNVIETIGFERRAEPQRANLEVVEKFLLAQNAEGRQVAGRERHLRWDHVPGRAIASLLDGFRTVEGATKANSRLLAEYVRSRLKESELTEWTVMVINNTQGAQVTLAGAEIGLTLRSHFAGRGREAGAGPAEGEDYRIRRLGDPNHEALDLLTAERLTAEALHAAAEARALKEAERDGIDASKVKRPALGPFARKARSTSRGLLVLYLLNPSEAKMDAGPEAVPAFLISFPVSPGAPSITYRVPRRYWEQEAS